MTLTKKEVGEIIVGAFAVAVIVYIFYGPFWACGSATLIILAVIAKWYMNKW